MNEKGIALLDSIITLSIILFITLTIVPFVNYLNREVTYAKQMLHASEVAYLGVSYAQSWGGDTGSHQIDGVHYQWIFRSSVVCVEFKSVKGEETYCIHANMAV